MNTINQVCALLCLLVAGSICQGQDVWKPDFTLNHSDRVSNPYQPQPRQTWLMERDGGSRWNHRGPKTVPVAYRASTTSKHVKVGNTLEARFTIESIDAELDQHGDWLLLFQLHGKNGPEDTQSGQVNITLRRDLVANYIPDGLSWQLSVHGDTKLATTSGTWANKRYAYVPFDESQLPITWYLRLKSGGDGKTPAENGRVYDIGQTAFYYKTAQMTEPAEVWPSQGPNYFPWQGHPTAGVQLPTFGLYASNGIKDDHQRVIYSDIAIAYRDEFTTSPEFDFGD